MGYSTQIELLVIARVVVARALGLRRTTGLHLLHGHTICAEQWVHPAS